MSFEKRKTKAEQKVLVGSYFRTALDAAHAWSAAAGTATAQDGLERAGMLFVKTMKDPKTKEKYHYYSISKTLVGKKDGVFWQFISLYLKTILCSILGNRGAAFMHTHPSGSGYGASNADRFLLYLPQIPTSFIYDVKRDSVFEDTKAAGVTWLEAFSDMLKNPNGTPRK